MWEVSCDFTSSFSHEKDCLCSGSCREFLWNHTESDASEQSLREQGLCCATSLQPYLTLCHPMDYSLPGSSAHGILQARILEQVAIFFSRGSSQPRDKTQVSCTAGRFFTVWATREEMPSSYIFFLLEWGLETRLLDAWSRYISH